MGKVNPKYLANYKVKWVITNEPLDFFMRIARSFERHMERRMPGRVTFEIMTAEEYSNKYNNGVPVNRGDVLGMLRDNEIQLADMPVPIFANVIKKRFAKKRDQFPDFVESDWSIIEMPFLFRNEQHATSFMQTSMGEELLYFRNLLAVKPMAIVSWGGTKLVAGDRAYARPKDFVGAKVHLKYQTAVAESIFESLGAEVTDDESAADMVETDMPSFDFSRKVITELNHSISSNVILASHEFWRNVIKCECDFREHTPEEEDGCLRKQLKRACNEATRDRDVWNSQMTREFREKCVRNGVKVNQVCDLTAFKQKTAPVYEKFVPHFYNQDHICCDYDVEKHDLRTKVESLSDNERGNWCDGLTID